MVNVSHGMILENMYGFIREKHEEYPKNCNIKEK